MSFEIDQEFQGLLLAVVDSELDQTQRRLLNARLRNDASARAIYRDYLMVHELLEWDSAEAPPLTLDEPAAEIGDEPGLDDAMIVPAIRIAEESVAFDQLAELLPPPPRTSAPLPPAQDKFSQRRRLSSLLRWRAAAVLLLVIGGAIAVLGILHHGPSAATLVASVDAKWDQETHAAGSSFATGTTSRLASGFAELHLAAGATVLVEGPAQITMRSDHEMFVSSGKIFATVPGGGFVVSTPVATVTDLGTEFGVDVFASDQCQVAVFKGKVQVEAKAQSQDGTLTGPASSSTVLVEGQAASVSSSAITPLTSSAMSQRFTRTLQAGTDTLDMVDLVAGGDGTTHRRDLGIDASGNWGAVAPVKGIVSDGLYHPVPGLAAVDGVFLPEGSPSATQLDSAGDSFVFPGPLGVSNSNIWAGARFPAMPWQAQIPSTLAGVDYSTAGHGLLLLHGARGVTFDLNAIRRLHPERRISALRCLIGNMYQGPIEVKADVWVFTDGHQRFEARNFSNHEKPRPVSVAIADTDHYLTLVTGFPPAARSNDSWVVAADPVLELQPR